MPENPFREPEEHNDQATGEKVTGISPMAPEPVNWKVSDASMTLGMGG